MAVPFVPCVERQRQAFLRGLRPPLGGVEDATNHEAEINQQKDQRQRSGKGLREGQGLGLDKRAPNHTAEESMGDHNADEGKGGSLGHGTYGGDGEERALRQAQEDLRLHGGRRYRSSRRDCQSDRRPLRGTHAEGPGN